jgi:hexosaminidase
MKSWILAILCTFAFVSFLFAQESEINIIPKPNSIERGRGEFVLDKRTQLVANGPMERAIAETFRDYAKSSYGLNLKIVSHAPKDSRKSSIIGFSRPNDYIETNDAYQLRVEPGSIQLVSTSPNGMYYGIQSLLQMIPLGNAVSRSIPAVKIEDKARFQYRGMHLDVGRHFMPVEFVKKYIDLMSQYKFNYFHWHLTEDQGWRIEIKKYPKLTEIGSKRPETVKGRNLVPYVGDGIPVEGFYTQDQIRDVVAYAKARYITVIPEIELPGHASAALAAYPELGCKADYKYKVQTTWGIFKEVYCPTDATFKFLEDVIDETISLFPDSPYVHIGGDEVLKDHWKESAFVQDLMKREGLKDEHEVQSYFVRRIEKYINSKGKKMIGWDEILEGGLAPNATVMSWRGIKGGIEAAKAHHEVIMTPTDFCYFDYGQGDPATEPINIGGYLPLEKVYGFDPVPKELNADEAKYIIGGQANVWTEYLKTPAAVEYMAFPRMLALAEAVWSRPEDKNYADFLQRLSTQFVRLDKQNVNYRIPEPLGLTNEVIAKGDGLATHVNSLVPGAKIVGTVDGSEPTETSPVFPSKFVANPPEDGVLNVRTMEILPSGRKSSVYTTTFVKREYLQPVELQEKRPGVTFGFAAPPIVTSGETRNVGFQQFTKTADLKQPFAVAFDGYFNAPVDGIYEFQVESKWDNGVSIGGQKLIDASGTGERAIKSELVPLKAGLHKISLRYNNRGGEPFWRVRWAIKGQNWRNFGGGDLVH